LPPEKLAAEISTCQEAMLEYIVSPGVSYKVFCDDFWRLMTYGRWVDSNVINWYSHFLSLNEAKSDFRFLMTDFCDKLMLTVSECADKPRWEKAHKYIQSKERFSRFCFPCYFDHHWILTLFDFPNDRPGRLCFIDSLQLFLPELQSAFQGYFRFRKFENVSVCLLRGGKQEKNGTECGIFCMQNMDAVLKTEPFFDLSTWNSAADQRSLRGCMDARQKYASILREHSIQWMRGEVPISLASAVASKQIATAALSVSHIVDEVILLSSDEEQKPALAVPKKNLTQTPLAKTGKAQTNQKKQQQPATISKRFKADAAQISVTAISPIEKWCKACDAKLGVGWCNDCILFMDNPPGLPPRKKGLKKVAPFVLVYFFILSNISKHA
jgi:hypothetical protein